MMLPGLHYLIYRFMLNANVLFLNAGWCSCPRYSSWQVFWILGLTVPLKIFGNTACHMWSYLCLLLPADWRITWRSVQDTSTKDVLNELLLWVLEVKTQHWNIKKCSLLCLCSLCADTEEMVRCPGVDELSRDDFPLGSEQLQPRHWWQCKETHLEEF